MRLLRRRKKSGETAGKRGPEVNVLPLARGVVGIKETVLPDSISIGETEVRVGNRYARTYVLREYPRRLQVGWMEPVYMQGDVDVAVHIYPPKVRDVTDTLTYKLAQRGSQLIVSERLGNLPDPALKEAVDELTWLREEVGTNRDRVFYCTPVVAVWAGNPEELEVAAANLRDTFAQLSIQERPLDLCHDLGLKSILPLGRNEIPGLFSIMLSGSTACMLPFANPEFTHPDGILLGENIFTSTPVYLNLWLPGLVNPHLGIFGTSGSGKTYTVRVITARSALLGQRTVLIDPEGEYRKLTESVGGVYVLLDPSREAQINPLDVEEDEETGRVNLVDKVIEVRGLVSAMCEGVTGQRLAGDEVALVDSAVRSLYAERGFGDDATTLYAGPGKAADGEYYVSRVKKDMPTLSDLRARLAEIPGAERVARTMEVFCRGGSMGLFDGPSRVNLREAPVVCFDVSRVEDPFLRAYVMYVILSWTWQKFAKKNPGVLKRIVVDEAWIFMKFADTAAFLENVARRGRKRDCALCVASQQFIEFAARQEGRAVLSNLATVILMRQASTEIHAVQEVFNLSDQMRKFLLGAARGECLVRCGDRVAAVRIVSPDFEKEFVEGVNYPVLKDGACERGHSFAGFPSGR